jgi:hypothetical protein
MRPGVSGYRLAEKPTSKAKSQAATILVFPWMKPLNQELFEKVIFLQLTRLHSERKLGASNYWRKT